MLSQAQRILSWTSEEWRGTAQELHLIPNKGIAVQKKTVFYAWMTGRASKTNRNFIESALNAAAKAIRRDQSIEIDPVIDRDTFGEPGSPDIVASIVRKIKRGDAVVADVSLLPWSGSEKPSPNPNVMFELGYAFAKTPESISMVFNDAYGAIEALPFDIRFRRPLRYCLPFDASDQMRAAVKRKLTGDLEKALRSTFQYQEESEVKPWLNGLASDVIRLLIALDGLDRQDEFSYPDLGTEVRDLAGQFQTHARQRTAQEHGWSARLAELARLCDELGTACQYGLHEAEELAQRTKTIAEDIKTDVIDGQEIDLVDVQEDIARQLRTIMGRLKDLDVRSKALIEGARSKELREKSKRCGTELLHVAHWAVAVPRAQADRLCTLARRLRRSGEMPQVMDSGASERATAAWSTKVRRPSRDS